MIRTILLYGLAGAVVVGAPMLYGMLTLQGEDVPENGALFGYLSMILALTAVFLGVKHHRDRALGGVIKFFPALGVGLAISAVASLGWVIAWEISLAATGFDFVGTYTAGMVEQAQARGAPEAEIQKIIANGEAYRKMYANPLIRVGITFIEMFPIGVLVSLVSAALLRNSRFLPARAAPA